jgi:HEAT repeat protein
MIEHTTAPFCIELLIDHLRSNDGVLRMKAREMLVKIGKPGVPYILPLLSHAEGHVRWEACKTLEHIRDPKTAGSIAPLLMDENMDVRWVAADALIELEHHAVIPLLELIEANFDSPMLREAAHHVLHQLKDLRLLDEMVEEVLNALKVTELPSKAAFTASAVLEHLRSAQPYSRKHIPQ